MAEDLRTVRDLDIAVVAMEGRFPGAGDVREFWANLVAGEESVGPVGDEEYLAAGGDPAALDDPYLVRAAAAMEGADLFDADFFGLRAEEAEMMDPQQRVFLEVCHHALEQSGHDPDRFDGLIGVYGGASQSRYYLSHVRPRFDESTDPLRAWSASMGNDPGVFATRVAYALNLTGPALTVQTACSTSLAAIHLACQDLLSYRCDLALAGGSSINPSAKRGYRYTPDGPFSPDGHLRAFDVRAEGMVPGDATAVVVLKRLTDAVADGDRIRAVIKGTAVNNDGNRKVGFTAPSPLGQAEVVLAAHAAAEVDACTIGYVEAHGTGTPVGDPIEVQALTRAFAETTRRTGFCAIGSAKTNVGHTDAAAGVVGLIKAALVVEHGKIPPTLHYTSPNPLIDFGSSPFRVQDRLTDWPAGPTPRRAGVSSFGVGGTNAHAVLEEPPALPARAPGDDTDWVLLRWSARSAGAADRLGALLGDHLARTPDLTLGDVAHTLHAGRRTYPHRRFAVCRDRDQAVALLGAPGSAAAPPADAPAERPVAFLFPGGGAQYEGMGRGLYETEQVFREALDRCAAILEPVLGFDVRAALHRGEEGPCSSLLPGLVATEYALATLLLSRGVRPQSFIGHSAGEYTAACLAGVMSLEDMLPLVAKRQWLLERAGGVAVSVRLGERDLDAHLTDRVSLATVNAPTLCTVSGPEEDIRELESRWDADGVEYQRVHFPSAVHSWLLDSILDDYAAELAKVTLHPPAVPFVSNVTGTWITDAEATSPDYWLRHTRRTVRFADGLAALRATGEPVLVEVGPGRILTRCAQMQFGDAVHTVETMRHPRADQDDRQVLLTALGRLWQLGAGPTPDGRTGRDGAEEPHGRRVPLPGYPFERTRHWLDEVRPAAPAPDPAAGPAPERDLAEAERALRRNTPVTTVAARLREDFDRLAALRATAFLRTAGVDTTPGRRHTREDLIGRLRPVGPYGKLLDALLHMLHESGVLAREGGELWFTGTDAAEQERLTRSVTERLPSLAEDLDLLDTCLAACAGVVRGDTDGTAVLTPDGRADLTADALETHMDEGDFTLYRTLLAEHVTELARAADGRPFRILEVGAGRGRLTWDVAEALRGIPGVRYHLTDLGRSFVLDAEREAVRRGIDFMSFGVLDVAAPLEPGAPDGPFDVVLAFNVLHIPSDLRTCVRHVQRLLAPGGRLYALETVRMPWASELSVGLLPQWWAFADDLRRHSPILPAAGWRELLASEGFEDVRVLSDEREERPLIPHALIAGRRPAANAHEPVARTAVEPERTPGESDARRQARPALRQAHRAPSTDTERIVARLWEELLRVDGIGADDNFFDLGGESLLALQLVKGLRDELGVELRVKKLMENLTVAAMAAEADALRGHGDAAPAPRISRSARRGRPVG